MRTRNLVVGLLVLGLAVGGLGMAALAKPEKGNNGQDVSDTATDAVTWTMQKYIELSIANGAYDFGTIDAGVDTVSDAAANTLFVRSNTKWELKSSVQGSGSEHLVVSLGAKDGQGDATVNVGYTLINLRSMNPGDYTVIVTYTATAK